MTGPDGEHCHILDDPDGPIVVHGTGPYEPRTEQALREVAAAARRDFAERDVDGVLSARQAAAQARNRERNQRFDAEQQAAEQRVAHTANVAFNAAHFAAYTALVAAHPRFSATPGHGYEVTRIATEAVAPILQAAALRAYAERRHGTINGVSYPATHDTGGAEYDTTCQCGMPLLVDDVVDGCGEYTQLLADAQALERGETFRDIAEPLCDRRTVRGPNGELAMNAQPCAKPAGHKSGCEYAPPADGLTTPGADQFAAGNSG